MSERINTPFTNEHFADWCQKMVGQPYWYGTCVYKATNSLLSRKSNQYPSSYASSRMSRYKQDIANKAVVSDCIGGCKGYAWTNGGQGVLEAISKAMTKAGKSLTTHVTAPITALGTAAIKASVDYEYAFANVRKTVDATEEEYDRLSDSVKQMSTEVAASAEDIAEVMSIAGQLGIENEHLAEFTRTMIDLGNSTNMVAADAASEAARFANIMGMSQNEFQNLGSTLVDLGNNYATTESEIMSMSLRLAGAGAGRTFGSADPGLCRRPVLCRHRKPDGRLRFQ